LGARPGHALADLGAGRARPHGQPLAGGPHSGRFLGRVRGGGGGRAGPAGDGQRRGRVGAHPGGLVRRRRSQGHQRPPAVVRPYGAGGARGRRPVGGGRGGLVAGGVAGVGPRRVRSGRRRPAGGTAAGGRRLVPRPGFRRSGGRAGGPGPGGRPAARRGRGGAAGPAPGPAGGPGSRARRGRPAGPRRWPGRPRRPARRGRLVEAGVVRLVRPRHPRRPLDPAPAWLALRARAGDPAAAGALRAETDARLARLFTRAALLLTPAAPTAPHGHEGPGDVYSTALTWAFNLSGHPALSLPAGRGGDGCPAGLQLVAPHGRETLLLAVARAAERGGATAGPVAPPAGTAGPDPVPAG